MFAFWNGDLIPASEVRLSPWDAGFVTGTTVSEQLRTFRGKLFAPQAHIARLARGLEIVGIDCGYSVDQLAYLVGRVVEESKKAGGPSYDPRSLLSDEDQRRIDELWKERLKSKDISQLPKLELDPAVTQQMKLPNDLGIGIFVTPGPYAALAGGDTSGPKVCIYGYPLAFSRWAEKYATGESLALVDVEMPSPQCWPPELKCRSRMHYHLADREAESCIPGSKALLRSAAGYLRETAIANILLVEAGQKVRVTSPPRKTILPGVSLAHVEAICDELGWEWGEREMTAGDLQRADEVWLTSTPWCVLPVTRFQGEPVRNGAPGPLYQQLLETWSNQVGLDIAAQARRWANP